LSDLSKGIDVYFGINLGCLYGTVPENICNLLQRRSVAKHRTGDRMAKHMSRATAWTFDASTAHGPGDNR
jgi:hypothetical protein